MWDLPRPRIEPVTPAFAGGFMTTEPPGEAPYSTLNSGMSLKGVTSIHLANDES